MATPHVTGIVSLMLSRNPSLTPAQVTSILQTTAREFPKGTGRDCDTTLCGAGIVDAGAAVAAAGGTSYTVTPAAGAGGTVSPATAQTVGAGSTDGVRGHGQRRLHARHGGGRHVRARQLERLTPGPPGRSAPTAR